MKKNISNQKKICMLGLTAFMCLGNTVSFWGLSREKADNISLNPLSATVYAANLSQFKDDIPNWASSDITYLVDKGIMNGYEDGTFRADGTMTRLEFITAVVRSLMTDAEIDAIVAEGKQDHPDTDGATYNPYKMFLTDLTTTFKNYKINQKPEDFWGAKYLFAAQELYISTGVTTLTDMVGATGDGAYMTTITREEACHIMYNACTRIREENLPDLKGIQNIINDGPEGINVNYATSVERCVANGLIAGIDDNYTIAAKQTLTRAQACAIIARITDTGRRLAKPVVPEELQQWETATSASNKIITKHNPVTGEEKTMTAIEWVHFGEDTYPTYDGTSDGEYSKNGWWVWMTSGDTWVMVE